MATCGRLEAFITNSSSWTVSVNDGIAYVATVSASSRTPTQLLAALVTALNTAATGAGSARTWTGSIASGEQGTGYATLTISAGANTTLTWTSTDLRDALGWAANLSGAITYTSPAGALGMWLPNSPLLSRRTTGNAGVKEGGTSQTVSPSGVTHTIKTVSRTRLPPVMWSHVTLARSLQASESAGVRSFERFVLAIRGDGPSYILPGAKVRFTWDADVSATYTDYYPIVPDSSDVAPVDQYWRGLFACSFEGFAA